MMTKLQRKSNISKAKSSFNASYVKAVQARVEAMDLANANFIADMNAAYELYRKTLERYDKPSTA